MDLPIWAYIILGIVAIILFIIVLYIGATINGVAYVAYSEIMDLLYRCLGRPPFNPYCSRAASGLYYFEDGHCVGKWDGCYRTHLDRFDK